MYVRGACLVQLRRGSKSLRAEVPPHAVTRVFLFGLCVRFFVLKLAGLAAFNSALVF